MYDYEYWFDPEGKMYKISEMDTSYILNCLNQLNKMLPTWRGITPEDLTREDLKQKDVVGMEAWFVFHGINYINAFKKELSRRENDDVEG